MATDVPESYIPPKWSDITLLLYYSAVMWSALFFISVLRELTELLLTPKLRRDSKGRASTNILARCILALNHLYKKTRLALMRSRIPEHDLIWNVRLPRCVVGACVCAFYCIDTHTQSVTPIFYFVQVLYGLVVLLSVIYDFVYEASSIWYMFRPGVIVECLSIPSLLLASNGLWLNLNFLQAYSILTRWYILEQHEIVLRNANALTRLYANISLELATFVFITACGVHFFELLGDPGTVAEKMFRITWANALYFAVVTLMTVGYGDFVPYTFVGRLWIVVHIIRAAYLVVREMDAFFKSEARQRRGIEAYVETMESSHIVVTGHVKWEYLKQLVEEFLKVSGNDNSRVVVLTCTPTWSVQDWDKFISRDVFYDYRVFHVDGSPLEHFDLERARVVSARAVFVLSDPHRGDPYSEDASCLKTILSIRKYGGNVPIFTFNVSENSSCQFAIAMEHIDDDGWMDLSSWVALQSERSGKKQVDERILDGVDNTEIYSAAGDEEQSPHNQGITSRLLELSSSNIFQDSDIPGGNRNGESLCTQELEMALLAENVYCNGLSTLLANLTLRFAPVPKPRDRFWLKEYKLGAQCCIERFKIAEKLDGRTYESVATFLQDYGIVILAVFDKDESWKIITVDTVLKKDTRCMIITYHSRTDVAWIMERVCDQLVPLTEQSENASMPSQPHSFDSGEISYRTRTFTPERRNSELIRSHSQDQASSFGLFGGGSLANPAPKQDEPMFTESYLDSRDMFSDDDANNAKVESSADIISCQSRRDESVGEVGVQTTDTLVSAMRRGLPVVFESATEEKRDDSIARSSNPKRKMYDDRESAWRQEPRDPKWPRFFSSLHPIPVKLSNHVIVCLDGEHSLTSLKVLLKNIWRKRKDQRRRTKVVVIHPNFPKNFDQEIQRAAGDLFLLLGHSLSVQTLEQAQYKRSRAMLILTSESRVEDSTRNTDSKAIFTVMTLDSLLDRARIYVCCMLDAEDSLRLMRAPKHSRQIAFSREDSGTFSMSSIKRSISGTLISSLFRKDYGTIRNKKSLTRESSPSNTFLSRGSNFTGTLVDEEAYQEDNELVSQNSQERRSGKYRSEGELCERQRYASGEMIISSLYAALLVREEAQPGFIKVIRGLLGLSEPSSATSMGRVDSSESWIRLLPIPSEWATTALPNVRNFRETSLCLQKLGCVTIGLYRSGRAPVRYMRREEGSFKRQQEGIVYERDTEKTSLLAGTHAGTLRFTLNAAFHGSGMSNTETSADSGGTSYDFDGNQSYQCPSTGRIIEFFEIECDNVLPYVYCFPEPYTVVDVNDGVFVICDPELSIATDWGLDSEKL